MPRRMAVAMLLVLATALPALAQRMPVTTFTRVHGLSHEYIFHLLTDSRGFTWLATQDGVSRYDGARFTTYHRADGVPDRAINAVFETRNKTIWISTNGGGVARFEPRGVIGEDGTRRLFTTFRVGTTRRTNRVNALAEDDAGTLWAATDGGLFQMGLRDAGFAPVPLSTLGLPDDLYISDVAPVAGGELWLGTTRGLVRRVADGRGTLYVATGDAGRPFVRHVVLDQTRRLVWALTTRGIFALALPPVGTILATTSAPPRSCGLGADRRITFPTRPGDGCLVGVPEGLANDTPHAMVLEPGGRTIIGHSAGGLTEIADGRAAIIEAANEEFDISALSFDIGGNLWIGTQAGAKRVQKGGFLSFSTFDGLNTHYIRRVQLDRHGRVIVSTHDHTLHWFEGGALRQGRFPLGPDVLRPSWIGSSDYRSPTGEWWVPTAQGLYRFPPVENLADLGRTRPLAVYRTSDGLATNEISHLRMDSRGDLWVGHVSTGGPAVSRLRAGATRFETLIIEGVQPMSTIVSFAEDRTGQMWMSMRDGGIARHRKGRVERVPGMPWMPGTGLFLDSRGRLWMCNIDGILRIENPEDDEVRIRRYGPDDGLDRHALTLVEDLHGRLFLGTLNGVVLFDPERRTVRHYTTADGLPASNVQTSVRDAQGDLWFGTARGLARLRPSELSLAPPGAPRISGVIVGDRRVVVSEFGDLEVSGLEVAPNQNRLHIDFFAQGGGTLPAQYQFRLSPDDPWSAASESRSVELAALSPARYRFEVRSVDPATGAVVPGVAVVAFRVLPPFWMRWWFLLLAAAAAVGAGYGVHRYRLAGAVRLERIRARIATDLHDDIGSSLSQIAILSEVSRQRIRNDPEMAHEPLGLIAETSRELVDKMSDIVWAVNPRRDSLSDLVYRMRRFADDTFGATDIKHRFTAPDSVHHLRLGPDVRRELLLILKESVTNIAKHARATEASIDIALDGSRLLLTIRDNGRGFDTEASFDGNGVYSMRNRVQALGGKLDIRSEPGSGTTVSLELVNS
jgi:signal transduction histidine kinase/ligand-binding sensor domain-containing protein